MHKQHHQKFRHRFLLITFAVTLLIAPQLSSAQSFQVIHNFTGATDGGNPPYTLGQDAAGHFFGTAFTGGGGEGLVFRFSRVNSGWVLVPLYNFNGEDGQPGWGVTLAPDGTIYTNAMYASVLGGPCGTAMQLRPAPNPPHTVFYNWTPTAMRTYVKSQEGCPTGNLLRDSAGNLYGVTQNGGPNGWGSVFELTKTDSGWTESILYAFTGMNDGGAPYSGLIMDSAGNLYGTASARGAFNQGTVFELSPSGSGWTEKVLYAFQGGNDGGQPVAGVIFDGAGNLFGATASWGSGGGGTVFKLTPSGGGAWTYSVLTSLTGTDGPVASLTMDGSGNLYGTTFMDDSFGFGSVFKLTKSGGNYVYTDLHDFTGGTDGGYPGGGVTLDSSGNIYGTAVTGGANGFGVIYQITQ